ncbi:MAG: radical SAM family heme chaperone HemW [Aureibaculum sp.]|nr:radical SAM family heme chaperone HemW [Aureibaculum sp.]
MAGIYLHIPFCKQACYYCDFHFSTSLKRKDEMIQALVKEIQIRNKELENEFIETIYFGGGTPSLLTIDEIQLLLDAIYLNFKVAERPEITLEANPDDLSEEQIEKLANSKINRLSIGIQSFFDDDLKAMNRAHSAEEAKRSLSVATRYFDNITIDLIYGIPTMSNARWKENLNIAFDFGVNHISSYALTVEPKTALESFIKKGKYPPIDEDKALQHFHILVEETEKKDFIQYEISNFGKPDYFSKHNTSYWLGKSYLGIGPSAHSYNGIQRSWNVSNNAKYLKSLHSDTVPQEIEELSVKDRFNETVMTGLRTIWGVSINEIESNFGADYKEGLLKNSEEFINQQLLEIVTADCSNKENVEKLKITKKGKFLVDGIASELFMI